jgi:DNA (cytosine-5)-methyltransferase 1
MDARITTRLIPQPAPSCENSSHETSLRQATLTIDPSRTCSPVTSTDTRNAISSQAEDCGPLQPALPDGQTTDLFGPAPVRASRSARRAKVSEQMIQGICGRTFIASFVPAGPLSSWESRLRGAAGYAWFDGVRADLALENYAGRCVDIPAGAVDAPHQRNRLYWIAVDDRIGARLEGQRGNVAGAQEGRKVADRFAAKGNDLVFTDADRGGRSGWPQDAERSPEERTAAERVDDRVQPDTDEPEFQGKPSAGQQSLAQPDARPLRNGSWWSGSEWIVSPLDGKARRAKPGIPFLVDGLPGRVDLWRVGGNAIVPILAAEVIASFLDAEAIGASA